MKDFHKNTFVNQRIPKQKFYEKIEVTPSLKQMFIDKVKSIYWRNKISQETTNIAPGKILKEFQVIEINLNYDTFSQELLRQIEKVIPYYILFLVEYQNRYQAWIGYKEAINKKQNSIKVNKYFHTDWFNLEDLPIELEGFSVDDVYRNFMLQIGGELLNEKSPNENLKDMVARSQEKQALQRRIDALRVKIYSEKQLNIQFELNDELKALEKELSLLE